MSNTSIPPLGGPSPAEDTFTVYSHKGNVRFLSRAVQPPSAVYVDVDDVLEVGCASSRAGEVVTVSYRLLRADGELIKGQFQVFPPLNRAIATKQEPLAEGFLLSVSCKATQAVTRGQTFVRVFLTDPALGGGQPSYMLMADYVTTAMAPAHPNGRVLAPSEGPGWVHTIPVPTPPAGSNWTLQTPVNARWLLKTGTFQLTTDPTVLSRDVNIGIQSGGSFVFSSFSIVSQTASQFRIYSLATATPYLPANPNEQILVIPPNMLMLGGDIIAGTEAASAVGDQFSSIFVAVEEWLDNV